MPSAVYLPAPPFDRWPEQWWVPGFGYAWVTVGPNALVTQSTIQHPSPEWVDYIQDFQDEALRLLGPSGIRGAVVLHDWRSFEHVDMRARNAWMARARRPGRPFSGLSATAVAISARPLVRVALQTAVIATRLVSGAPSTVLVGDPTGFVRTAGLHPPPDDLLRRLRSAPTTLRPPPRG